MADPTDDPDPPGAAVPDPWADGDPAGEPDHASTPRPCDWPFAVGVFGPAGVFLLLEPWREDLVAGLQPWLGAGGAVWAAVGLICTPLVVGCGWSSLRTLRHDYRGARCPYCGERPTALWPDLPYRGVTCLRCGRRLAADPPAPDPPPDPRADRLMTVDEFRTASARPWWRAAADTIGQISWSLLLTLVLAVVLTAVMNATVRFFIDRFGKMGGIVAWSAVVFIPLSVGSTMGLFGLSIRLHIHRLLTAPSRVPCPHCGRGLEGFRDTVTASKCCPFCRGRVLAVPPDGVA